MYKLEYLPTTDSRYAFMHNRVLRVRKQVDDITTIQLASYFIEVISKVLEPRFLVEHELVHLTEGFITSLNLDVRQLEVTGWRATKHVGVPIKPDAWGLLLTDMTSMGVGTGQYTIEFKPKWLCQSPDAPLFARRCRTCALRAQRESDRRAKGQPPSETRAKASFCPLALLSNDPARLTQVARALFAVTDYAAVDLQNKHRDHFIARFVDFFSGDADGRVLLSRLRHLQTQHDATGVLSIPQAPSDPATAIPLSPRFQLAMTLRDCSLLMKIPFDMSQPIDARLADLDPKGLNPAKVEEWRGKEWALLEDGWYTCNDAGGTGWEGVCILGGVEWWV